MRDVTEILAVDDRAVMATIQVCRSQKTTIPILLNIDAIAVLRVVSLIIWINLIFEETIEQVMGILQLIVITVI